MLSDCTGCLKNIKLWSTLAIITIRSLAYMQKAKKVGLIESMVLQEKAKKNCKWLEQRWSQELSYYIYNWIQKYFKHTYFSKHSKINQKEYWRIMGEDMCWKVIFWFVLLNDFFFLKHFHILDIKQCIVRNCRRWMKIILRKKIGMHWNISLGKITYPSVLAATAHFWTNALNGHELCGQSMAEYARS